MRCFMEISSANGEGPDSIEDFFIRLNPGTKKIEARRHFAKITAAKKSGIESKEFPLAE